MEDNKDFEKRIRAELKHVGNYIKPSEDLYLGIMTNITNNKKGRLIMFKNKFVNTGTKKVAAALLCFTIAMTGFSLSTSGGLRTFAAETLNKIKTIFVLDDSNKVVEKEANNKDHLTSSVSKSSNLNDAELSEKVGFKVVFPDTLSDSLKLIYKSELIILNNIDYISTQEVQKDAFEAIDNVDKFKSMEKYNPTRGITAAYEKAVGGNIYITLEPITTDLEKKVASLNTKEMDINGIKGYWRDIPSPVYPMITQNGITQADWTKKPTAIESAHQLNWFSNGLHFVIDVQANQENSMQEAENIAKAFMAPYSK